MRLKNISLSGFKSFVDPTKIAFPSEMSGVVGPNGCGKSNIIDAVRWVMGEISAKNLRGESMADIIFNGSSSRAPSARASVELLFDNGDGRIGGEYSSYSEISVKRTVDIDGKSTYFLNNSECRRKDITANYELNDITIDHRFHLINFVSSRMNTKQFDNAMKILFHVSCLYDRNRWYRFSSRKPVEHNLMYDLPDSPRGYGLSSTPLNDTIMAAYKLVPAFVKRYSIDKMNTIFLTDGCSDGNNHKIVDMEDGDQYAEIINDKFKRGYMMSYNKNSVLVDRKTKRQYHVDHGWRNPNGLTENLLQILKDRTGSKVLGFYVSARKRIDNYAMDKYFDYQMRSKIHAQFRKDKVVTVTHSTGYDEIYLLAGDNMQVQDGQMATPSENAKKGEIKRLFTSTLKGNKQSRVMLNKFISKVA